MPHAITMENLAAEAEPEPVTAYPREQHIFSAQRAPHRYFFPLLRWMNRRFSPAIAKVPSRVLHGVQIGFMFPPD